MSRLSLILIVSCLFSQWKSFSVIADDSCSARSHSCPPDRDSGDEEWNQAFLSVIRDAEQKYDDAEEPCFQSQVQRDLKPWLRSGVTEDMILAAREKGILYQVIDGQLFREDKCLFPARCDGVDHIVKQISRNLSDTEFVVNFHDWPQVPKWARSGRPPPVFSFSKSDEAYSDILYPGWSFVSGGPALDLYPTGIGQWHKFRDSISRSSGEWEAKEGRAFFRGSRTSSERDGLILLSRSHPDLIDAQYTKNQAWRSLKDTLGVEPAATVSFESQCRFKYLVNMKGVAASFRYKHLFLCRSLVLNVQSDWIEFFYPFLRPWIHYVPIASDFSDLVRKVRFLQANDSIAKMIAGRGFEFIWRRLTMDSVECYWRHLLSQYTHLLQHTVRPDPSLIPVR